MQDRDDTHLRETAQAQERKTIPTLSQPPFWTQAYENKGQQLVDKSISSLERRTE